MICKEAARVRLSDGFYCHSNCQDDPKEFKTNQDSFVGLWQIPDLTSGKQDACL